MTDYTQDANCSLAYLMEEDGWNGTENEVVDTSANNNHGVASGNATTDANGKFGRCGIFDGTGDYVVTPLSLADTDFSIVAWVKADVIEEGATIVDGRGDYLTLRIDFVDDDKWEFYIWDTAERKATYTVTAQAGQWYHLAAVYDKDNNIKLYVDGDLKDTTECGTVGGSGACYIGARYNGTYEFDGRIDEVGIFDRVLNSTEINDIMDNGLTGAVVTAGFMTTNTGYWGA